MTVELAIEYVDPMGLTPNPKNPRKHSEEQVTQIQNSIEEFGFTSPILVKNGVIYAGHGRHRAALGLKLPAVPVIDVSHLSDPQLEAFMVADNRIPQNATWDETVLANIVREIEGSDLDVALLGFSEVEVDLMTMEEGAGHIEEETVIPEAADPTPPPAVPLPKYRYILEFSSEEQLQRWNRFLDWLREESGIEADTVSDRLDILFKNQGL